LSNPPLVAHVIYRLGVGGLENGLVNLINQTPDDKYRHSIICLKDATDFRKRLKSDVTVHELHRREGNDLSLFPKIFKLFKSLQPSIVHTRNLAAVECQLPAWLAGVPIRIHGEHGWDVFDPDGNNRKYQLLRRAYKPLIDRYIPLSSHLENYLLDKIKVPTSKITRICNGVDSVKFHPANGSRMSMPDCPFPNTDEVTIIGTAGRMHGVKDQLNLVKGFILALEQRPDLRQRARLVLIGDGPLKEEANDLLKSSGNESLAWLCGERSDVDSLMRGLDIFVLPSKAEGISNTILEAMATGLPVIATAVGGNPELVGDNINGRLIPKEDSKAMALAITEYLDNPSLIRSHGLASRKRIIDEFSLDSMVSRYMAVYDELSEIKNMRKN
jgi:sugar transferase (PEP-CTERM/EpsH1 system associated)